MVYGAVYLLDKACVRLAWNVDKKPLSVKTSCFAHLSLWICSGFSTGLHGENGLPSSRFQDVHGDQPGVLACLILLASWRRLQRSGAVIGSSDRERRLCFIVLVKSLYTK
jgi:hypothetical protein